MTRIAHLSSPKPQRRPARPLFIGHEIYRRSNFGPKHPLSVPRVPATIDLCRAMGWLADAQYFESAPASPAEIVRFHDPYYLQALRRGERALELPPEDGAALSWLYRHGEVVTRSDTESGRVAVTVRLRPADHGRS